MSPRALHPLIARPLGASALIAGLLSAPALGQSSPADLADLSLAELMEIQIYSSAAGPAHERPAAFVPSWQLGLRYMGTGFEGYRDGTRNLSNEEVLFRPGETRTDENFPVLPTRITQQAWVAELGYRASARTSFHVFLPYISQSSDHISAVAGYEAFNIRSEGLGDIGLTGTRALSVSDGHSFSLSAGLSLPTGSISEKGDTPRAPGDQQLPYTMQLGSGTWDFSLGAAFSQRLSDPNDPDSAEWGLQAMSKFRTGHNSRDYRLGHHAIASAWYRTRPIGALHPSARLSARDWGRIHGEDLELSVPGPFPYSAPVVDPSLFGGKKVSLILGVELPLTRAPALRRPQLGVELGAPIYQSLNGPQPEEDWYLSVSLRWGF